MEKKKVVYYRLNEPYMIGAKMDGFYYRFDGQEWVWDDSYVIMHRVYDMERGSAETEERDGTAPEITVISMEEAMAVIGDIAVTGMLERLRPELESWKKEWDTQMRVWPAKYVRTSFTLYGYRYTLYPWDLGIGLTDYNFDQGFMEYIQGFITQDLEDIGATNIRHYGELD